MAIDVEFRPGQWTTGVRWRRSILGALLGLTTACVGLPPSAPGPDTDDEGASTSTTNPEPTGADAASADDPSATSEPGDTTDEPATTTEGGTPTLAFEEEPSYDFGLVEHGGQSAHIFTLVNRGDGVATGLQGTVSGSAYAFFGDFPNSGTCGETLAPGQECTLEVIFAPATLGPHDGELVVTHDGPDVPCTLTGGGEGRSENLLLNAGGEDTGSPPPSWTVVSGAWSAASIWGGVFDPVEGSSYLAADQSNDDMPISLRQDVVVEPWGEQVDQGVLRFSFSGYARSLEGGNDQYRMHVRYLDDQEGILAEWDTQFDSAGSWQQHEDVRVAPPGTRTVRVTLMCRKEFGDWCDAFFDALELVAVYP